jgi:acetylornithine deacetylase
LTHLKKTIFNYVDRHQNELVDFLSKLIELKPVNPGVVGKGEELVAQKWVRDRLKEFGFDKVDYWAADPQGKRPNVVATLGVGGGKSLIYNGHIDVVPVSDAQLPRWTVDPWKATVKDGMVYGRGSSDMLGPVAAMIWAARALVNSGVKLRGPLYLECVSGEESNEGSSIGTNSTIERGYVAPFAVVCEPTNCEIHTATCGAFLFEMTIPGREIHTSMKNLTLYPQRYGIPHGSEVGVDAIAKTVKYLSAFQELEKNWVFRWRHNILGGGGWPMPADSQGVGIFSITPTLIEGGTYIGSLPGYCKITCVVYFPSWTTARNVWEEIKEVVKSVSSNDDWLKEHPPTLKIDKSVEGTDEYFPQWEPNDVPIDHEGCKSLELAWKETTGREAVFSGFKAVCDVTHFGKKEMPAVVFGPGDLSMGAHGPDERVSIKDMVDCCKTYAAMAVDWCGLA